MTKKNLYASSGMETEYWVWTYCPNCGVKHDAIDTHSKSELKKLLLRTTLWDGLCGDCEQDLFGKIDARIYKNDFTEKDIERFSKMIDKIYVGHRNIIIRILEEFGIFHKDAIIA